MTKISSSLIGQSLRALRIASGRKPGQVAKAAKLTTTRLLEIENGSVRTAIATFQQIALALGTDLVDVVRDLERGNETVAPVAATLSLDQIAKSIVELSIKTSKMEAVFAAVVAYAMKVTGDNQSAAARLVGMERKAFVRRLAKARRRK
jgi:transcriptional regulator with XRE-family HTH domain